MYSISNLPELIVLLKKHNLSFHITNLTYPSFLSTTILPKATKKEILIRYQELFSKQTMAAHEIENLKGVLSYMIKHDHSHEIPAFKHFNDSVDQSRDEKFETVFPEFAEWYTNI